MWAVFSEAIGQRPLRRGASDDSIRERGERLKYRLLDRDNEPLGLYAIPRLGKEHYKNLSLPLGTAPISAAMMGITYSLLCLEWENITIEKKKTHYNLKTLLVPAPIIRLDYIAFNNPDNKGSLGCPLVRRQSEILRLENGKYKSSKVN